MPRTTAVGLLAAMLSTVLAAGASAGPTPATTQIDALLSPISVEIAADTEKLYDTKSSNVGRGDTADPTARGYVWVAVGEGAPKGPATLHCLGVGSSSAAYIFYAAVAEERSGKLDWSNVHAVYLSSNLYSELLLRGPDKLIVGPRASAPDSWSVVAEGERIDPFIQYYIEASDSPQPKEIRLTLRMADTVAAQDSMLAKRAMLDKPLVCPRPPFGSRSTAKGPIDLARIPYFH